MRLKLMFAAVGLLYSSSGLSQTPPPPPGVWQAQLSFFTLLPDQFPAANTAGFEQLVAIDVQVYRDGNLIHQTRSDWLKELQSYKQASPTDPRGFSVSRDQYAILADGSVSVREFTYPIAPEGRTVFYHPSYPLRYVVYRFGNGRVVRVDYGYAMADYTGLCEEVAKLKEKSAARMELCR